MCRAVRASFLCCLRSDPKNLDYDALSDSQNARTQELVDKGTSFPEATRAAAKETAQKNNIAYYEGQDGSLRKLAARLTLFTLIVVVLPVCRIEGASMAADTAYVFTEVRTDLRSSDCYGTVRQLHG